MKEIDAAGYLRNKSLIERVLELRECVMSGIDRIKFTVRRKMEGSGERFLNIMMKLSIIKLAAALITLIVMTVLFFSHLHVFDAITLQFTSWTSSSIICFIVLIIAIKFIGLSIGLTMAVLSVKKLTFEDIQLWFRERCKTGLSVFLKKKPDFQKI